MLSVAGELLPEPAGHDDEPSLDEVIATVDRGLKLYTYTLHFADASELVRQYPKCTRFQWAGDYHLIEKIRASEYATDDPAAADFLIVPFLAKCYLNYAAHGKLSALGRAFRRLTAELETHEAWRQRPDRHVFFFMSGIGASMLPDPPGWAAVPRLKEAIFIVAEGDREADYFRYGHDIVVPGWVTNVPDVASAQPGSKSILGFFRGGMDAALKDAEGHRRFKPNVLRRDLRARLQHEADFVFAEKASTYASELRRSIFCIIPRGNTPWTKRFFDAVLAGCIPVVLSDPISFAFEHLVNFHRFTLKLPEREGARLAEVVRAVTPEQVERMGAELLRWRRAFDYGERGRAFELLLVELSLRKNRTLGLPHVPTRPRTTNSPKHFWTPAEGLRYIADATKLGPTYGGGMVAHRRARLRRSR